MKELVTPIYCHPLQEPLNQLPWITWMQAIHPSICVRPTKGDLNPSKIMECHLVSIHLIHGPCIYCTSSNLQIGFEHLQICTFLTSYPTWSLKFLSSLRVSLVLKILIFLVEFSFHHRSLVSLQIWNIIFAYAVSQISGIELLAQ